MRRESVITITRRKGRRARFHISFQKYGPQGRETTERVLYFGSLRVSRAVTVMS